MGIVASAICCCSSCAVGAGSCCCAAGKGANAMGRQAAKASYVGLLGVGTLLAWIGQRYFEEGEWELGQLDFKCDGQDGDEVCSDDGFVYRVSLMMTAFFFLMLLLTLPFPTMSGERRWAPLGGDSFQGSAWAFKLIIFFAMLGVTVVLPSSVFDEADNGWAWACRVTSSLFLVLQVLMLIDFGFQWNEDWWNRSLDEMGNPTNKGWLIGIIVLALTMNALAVAAMVFMFIEYKDCSQGQIYVGITFAAYLVYTVPLTLFREQLIGQPGAVLPSSVVALYTAFLVWSAVESLPEASCRPFDDGSDLVVFAGVGFATVTLIWTSYTASRRSQNLIGGSTDEADSGKTKPDFTGIYTIGTDTEGKDILARDADDRHESHSDESGNANDKLDDKPWLFHVFMITGAMYSAMLLTNWGVSDASAAQLNNESIGETSFWVKIISQWLCIGLYTWVLVAPKLLSDREFDF